ncbi:hypothetical protein GOP47_0005249 [Adiantum capillus-veneris]|uniref:Uncharacterized protein n=1 Tax=Adiantum capillus-veneris TaxID=13818 RepID=A0A9D4V4R8_ADICA|nr:hypothetical protein GOP47_0005249 [Adiantum capillus-veneris]
MEGSSMGDFLVVVPFISFVGTLFHLFGHYLQAIEVDQVWTYKLLVSLRDLLRRKHFQQQSNLHYTKKLYIHEEHGGVLYTRFSGLQDLIRWDSQSEEVLNLELTRFEDDGKKPIASR